MRHWAALIALSFLRQLSLRRILQILAFLLVGAVAVFLRARSYEPFKDIGFDETIYRHYVDYLGKNGLSSYPDLIARYNDEQEMTPLALLPPTRVSFLVAATTWQRLFGGPTIEALRRVSALASVLLLFGAAFFAWRLGGFRPAFGVFALLAVAPTQISMAHRALIDGFFGLTAFLVIWTLWETMQRPTSRTWSAVYGLSLALMVATKENAVFVYLAVLAILLLNRWLRFGRISEKLLASTVVGPLAGILVLTLCAGGIHSLFTVFSVNAEKSSQLVYAAQTGDGPWFRYLIDLLLTSPAVLLFAIGGIFGVRGNDKPSLFLLTFLLISYLAMANVPLGMNLRYANMWDFSLRWLALLPLLRWLQNLTSPPRQRTLYYGFLFVLVVSEFANYTRIFLTNEMYDPVTFQLMRALKMLH